MLVVLLALSAVAADPRCKGRVSARDQELGVDLLLDASEDGPQLGIEIRTGTGPTESRASVQARLRTRIDALIACYEPRVTATGGPDLTVRVAFDVADGRPANVSIDTPPDESTLSLCLTSVVETTAMPCKLDAQGFVFPVHFYTPVAVPVPPGAGTPQIF